MTKISAMTEKLLQAIELVTNAPKVPQKGGKKYTQVQDRVEAFRKIFGFEYGIETKLLKDDGNAILIQATITDSNARVIGSGLAEEIRGSSNVNKTSAIENGETSAIGRALASAGLHGGEYASVNELDKADRQTEKPPPQVPDPLAPAVQTENLQPAPAAEVIPEFLKRDTKTDDWAQEQIDGMAKHKHLGEHKAWKTVTKQTMGELKTSNPPRHQAVVDAYTNRYHELTNKGV